MSTATAAVAVMAAMPIVMVGVGSEVTLAVPPPTAMEEEQREIGLPASLGGGAHGSPSWSELEESRGSTVRLEEEQPLASLGALVMDVPCSSEEDTRVEPPAILSSRELVMIKSTMAESSS